MSYHCDLRSFTSPTHWSEKVDYKPFKNAQDMTEHLGITVEEWISRQRRTEKAVNKPIETLFRDLI